MASVEVERVAVRVWFMQPLMLILMKSYSTCCACTRNNDINHSQLIIIIIYFWLAMAMKWKTTFSFRNECVCLCIRWKWKIPYLCFFHIFITHIIKIRWCSRIMMCKTHAKQISSRRRSEEGKKSEWTFIKNAHQMLLCVTWQRANTLPREYTIGKKNSPLKQHPNRV